GGGRRTPRAGRIWGSRDRGEDRRDTIRRREGRPVPRGVPRVPTRDDWFRSRRRRREGREQFGVRSEDATSRRRPTPGATGCEGDGRDDAPRGPRDRRRSGLEDG